MNVRILFVVTMLLLFVLVACPAAKSPDKEEPVLSLKEVAVSSSSLFNIEGNVKDSAGDIAKLTVKVNDNFPVDITGSVESDGTFSAAIVLDETIENTLTVVATDASNNQASQAFKIRVQLAKSSLSGHLWVDADGNGVQNGEEANLVGRIIYLDQNDNRNFDESEIYTKTDEQGNYRFTNLAQGNYIVRQVMGFGEVNTFKRDVNLLSETKLQPQIVGGVETTIDKYPFMVSLAQVRIFNGQKQFLPFCGATLVTSHYVLTAAHCVSGPVLNTMEVMLSPNNLAADTQATFHKIKTITTHPKYNGNTKQGYDVALIELKEPVELKDNIYTIELNAEVAAPVADTIVTTIGWGKLNATDLDNETPDNLHVVHTKIFDSQACLSLLNSVSPSIDNFNTQLCAAVPEGSVDACQGDSGGPLMMRKLEGDKQYWVQVGITSWGFGCASAKAPGIWANIASVYKWISESTSGESLYYAVRVAEDEVKEVDFANQTSTRPFRTEIVDRWQLTNFESDKSGFFNAKEPINLVWNIFSEAAEQSYSCNLKTLSSGNTKVKNIPCQTGENTFTIAQGLEQGLNLAELSVESQGVTFNRNISVPVAANQAQGEFTEGDILDPDFLPLAQHRVDYYELTGVSAGTDLALYVTGNAPYIAVWVYDKELRITNSNLGGVVDSFVADTVTQMTTQEGVEYIFAVTSQRELATGDYTLSVTDGVLNPFTFPEPTTSTQP